jgi:hypothetical protein
MMILVATLSALLAQSAATVQSAPAAQPSPGTATRRHDPFANLFKSEASPAQRAQPSPAKVFLQHPQAPAKQDEREIICGMVVVHKSIDFDKAIVIPPNDTKSAVRRIEPQVCSATHPGPAR